MGLLFQMPVKPDPLDDRIKLTEEELTIKSYGLPMVFWAYLAAIFTVVFFMILAASGPLMKIINGEDLINRILGIGVLALFILGPIIILGFYFYEKVIVKNKESITVTHKAFFIPILKKSLPLINTTLEVIHHMDSPNKALLEQRSGMKGFENRGYFRLVARNSDGRKFIVDRNGRKGEMKKLLELLNQSQF